MKVTVEQDYKQLRQKEYEDVGNQLDAVFKLAKALKEQGITLPEDTLLWIDSCQSVKDKFKP